MEKMTIKEQLLQVKAYLLDEDVEMTVEDMVAFVDGRLAQLEKKAGKGKAKVEKPEDVALKQQIYDVLVGAEDGLAIKEIRAAIDGLSSQKAVAMLKQMEADGRVEKVDGKVAKYVAIA